MTRPGSNNRLETWTTLGARRNPKLVLTMDRIEQLAPRSRLEAKSPEDVVITLAIRSPMCKVSRLLAFIQRTEPRRGGFKDMRYRAYINLW